MPTVVPQSAAHALSWAYKTPQPGFFWKRRLLNNGFSDRWHYLFDHELIVRLLLEGYRCEYLPLPIAAYRLHDTSKTVSEWGKFDKEFDAIARLYEHHLRGAERRWCIGTRLLRQSVFASRAGNNRKATRCLLQALFVHPEGIKHRLFWGSLRRVLRIGYTPGQP